MPTPRQLNKEEYRQYWSDPMIDITASADPAADIWPYVEKIDLDALGVPHLNDVHYVYQDGSCRYHHVLVGTGRFNELLVVIVDLQARSVTGHYLLDLNKEFDVKGGHLRAVDQQDG
jgi:hypothetical protein